MLLGYRPDTGSIEFLFTDTAYLKKQFPNNTAKISNFWKGINHGLVEFFIEGRDFPDYNNYKIYKIINKKIIKKTAIEIEAMMAKYKRPSRVRNASLNNINFTNIDAIQKQIDVLQAQLNKLKGIK